MSRTHPPATAGTSEHYTIEAVDAIADASHRGDKNFGQQIGELMQLGVESYHADYRARRTTYYLAGGHAHTVALPTPQVDIPPGLDAAALQAAIRGAQAGMVHYPQFMQLSMAAGCVGYLVWISGRHVSYFGRQGEVHVEHFQKAPSGENL